MKVTMTGKATLQKTREQTDSSKLSRLEQAKASVAQSRIQAREYQARQRQLQAQAREISSQEIEREPLIQRGGFKPFLEA